MDSWDLPRQVRAVARSVAVLYGPVALALFALALYLAPPSEVSFYDLVKDPPPDPHPWYVGILSSAGVAVWGFASLVLLLASARLRTAPEAAAMMLHFGLFTAVLLVDDLFQLHEKVLEETLGIGQLPVYAAYGAMSIYLVVRFRGQLRRSACAVLLVALGFLAGSVALDTLAHVGFRFPLQSHL